MMTGVLIFGAGFLLATAVAVFFRSRGLRLIRGLQQENEDLLVEESQIFSFLHELGDNLGHDRGMRRLHQEIVEGVGRLVGAEGCALYLMDSRTASCLVPMAMTLDCPPVVEIPQEVLDQKSSNALGSYVQLASVTVGQGPVGVCFGAQQPMHLGALAKNADLFERLLPEQAELEVMAAPLTLGDRQLGVMVAVRRRRAFTPHTFEVFRSAAEQCAFALASAVIQQEAMDKRRMEEELRSASEVQRILLPKTCPDVGPYHISASNLPAKVMSGDYYDFIPVDAGHTGLVIADVSGKGVPASLVMATCRALLRGQAPGEPSPTAALGRVNRMLFGDIREDMFISLAYLILDVDGGAITLSRAGHDAPLLFSKATGKVSALSPAGLALGVDGGKVFERVTRDLVFTMEPGDCLLLYTDGVNEAMNAEGDEFGMARLTETFRQAATGGSAEVVRRLEADVRDFAGGAVQHDDITLVVVEKR